MTYSVVVRREAFSLLGQGLPAKRVAALLGVSYGTARRWRFEVGGVIRERRVESGRYLSREERYEIARLHDAGTGVRGIARRVGRSPSTISRELARPRRPVGAAGRPRGRAAGRAYQPEAAHQAALLARDRPRASKLSQNPRLKEFVQDRLDERDSPEQIAGRLLVLFPDEEEMRISHETIYRPSTSARAAGCAGAAGPPAVRPQQPSATQRQNAAGDARPDHRRGADRTSGPRRSRPDWSRATTKAT